MFVRTLHWFLGPSKAQPLPPANGSLWLPSRLLPGAPPSVPTRHATFGRRGVRTLGGKPPRICWDLQTHTTCTGRSSGSSPGIVKGTAPKHIPSLVTPTLSPSIPARRAITPLTPHTLTQYSPLGTNVAISKTGPRPCPQSFRLVTDHIIEQDL